MKSNVIMLQYYINGLYTDKLLAEINDHYADQLTDTIGWEQGWDGYTRKAFYLGKDMTMLHLTQLGQIHYFNIIELEVRYKDVFPLTVLHDWKPKWIRVGEKWENDPFTTEHGENADFILPWGKAVKDTHIPPDADPKDPGVRREIPVELRPISPG